MNDVSAGAAKKSVKDKGKAGAKDESKGGPEGVVTKVNDKGIWIAFGQQGGGARSKEDDEAIEELWSKKLWWYVACPGLVSIADGSIVSSLRTTLRIDGKISIQLIEVELKLMGLECDKRWRR